MRPGDTTTKVFHVMDADGAPVTGLTLSDYTIVAYNNGVVYTHSSAITELTGGNYKWTYVTPATRGEVWINCQPNAAANTIAHAKTRSVSFAGEVENQDLDSVYAANARPIITLRGSGTIGQVQALVLSQNRFRRLEFTFVDSNGDPVLLDTDYDNYLIAVRSADQATTIWDGADATITPDDSGVLTVDIPEDASFFDALDVGETSALLYYEITADFEQNADQTISLVPSSPLTLNRVEVGTGGP